MKRALFCLTFVVALSAPLLADSNLKIADAGLHGYFGMPLAIRLSVRNPSAQPQTIHLRVVADSEWGRLGSVTGEVELHGGEERQVELPLLTQGQNQRITAQASTDNTFFAHESKEVKFRSNNLVVLMCASDRVCKSAQSQMEFSGSVENRADKNRNLSFEVVDDPRDNWWSYSPAGTIVLALPVAKFTPAQKEALEGYLRRGGRLVLLEHEIDDPTFLSAYRQSQAPAQGERVGKGTLFRISGITANTLGEVFAGYNLAGALRELSPVWWGATNDWLHLRFATAFTFPRLRWIMTWLAVYILVIGVVNFAVLRRIHRLELGWISMCGLALLFAAGLYASSASRRPKEFRLDNLATYSLDARSPVAAADYGLRISAPERRDVVTSVADSAIFVNSNFAEAEANSDIWMEMNRQATRTGDQTNIRFGPPREVDLALLKWSYRDLNLQGLHRFPGTVHFVAPNRLRNDTGQHFSEAVYLDNNANALYSLPPLSPGEEIALDNISSRPIRSKEGGAQPWPRPVNDQSTETLLAMAESGALYFANQGRVFVGLSDGPALPVKVGIPYQESVHTMITVVEDQP
jgi:hypothetical protein